MKCRFAVIWYKSPPWQALKLNYLALLITMLTLYYACKFAKVFPQASPQERQRFELLKKAYVDARYNMDYKINKEDLDYLSERVQLLRKLTEEICREKIVGFYTVG